MFFIVHTYRQIHLATAYKVKHLEVFCRETKDQVNSEKKFKECVINNFELANNPLVGSYYNYILTNFQGGVICYSNRNV